MKPIECCGQVRDTRYCPSCGQSLWDKTIWISDYGKHGDIHGLFTDDDDMPGFTLHFPDTGKNSTEWISVWATWENGVLCIQCHAEHDGAWGRNKTLDLFKHKINFEDLRSQLLAMCNAKEDG